MQKYTDEEIEKMQEEIPEWKRTAVQVGSDEVEEKSKGVFKWVLSKAKDKIA